MLTASLITLDGLVTASDRGFYRALGQRLAEARKASVSRRRSSPSSLASHNRRLLTTRWDACASLCAPAADRQSARHHG